MNDWLKNRPSLAFLLNASLTILAVIIAFKLNSWASDKEKVENRLNILEEKKATTEYVDKKDNELSKNIHILETKLDGKASKEDINLIRQDIRDLRKWMIDEWKR